MNISIVIPNYNGADILKKNLPKVIEYSNGAEIIIVDDASTDVSVGMLQKEFPSLKVIVRAQNEGFASSVNDGVKASLGDLILLLNSDVEPEKGFLEPLIPYFQDHKVFAVGCLQETEENEENNKQGRGVGKFFHGFLVHGPGTITKETTLWVFGGAGMFRKNVWNKLGGMDTIYNPFYWEDIDLSYRALKSGYKIMFEPNSKVKHLQKTGSIRKYYTKAQITSIAYRNQILFIWLNITDWRYLLEHSIYVYWYLLKSLISLDFVFLVAFLKAVTKLPQITKKRFKNMKSFRITDKEILAQYKNET